jgi:hypothetical protein
MRSTPRADFIILFFSIIYTPSGITRVNKADSGVNNAEASFMKWKGINCKQIIRW